MQKTRRFILLTAAAVLLASVPAYAANDSKTVNVTATVNSKASLTLGAAAVSFADADPDATPSIVATALDVTLKTRTGSASSVTLTVLASGDLLSGTDVITIDNITWTATGADFVAGTMNKTTAQSLASWTGPGNKTGTQTYALANSWTYVPGVYTTIITYTLTAP